MNNKIAASKLKMFKKMSMVSIAANVLLIGVVLYLMLSKEKCEQPRQSTLPSVEEVVATAQTIDAPKLDVDPAQIKSAAYGAV